MPRQILATESGSVLYGAELNHHLVNNNFDFGSLLRIDLSIFFVTAVGAENDKFVFI